MENHHFWWENPLFLWSFSIAMLNYQRVFFGINAMFTTHDFLGMGLWPSNGDDSGMLGLWHCFTHIRLMKTLCPTAVPGTGTLPGTHTWHQAPHQWELQNAHGNQKTKLPKKTRKGNRKHLSWDFSHVSPLFPSTTALESAAVSEGCRAWLLCRRGSWLGVDYPYLSPQGLS